MNLENWALLVSFGVIALFIVAAERQTSHNAQIEPRQSLSPGLSIYLDLMRLSAALGVFIGHSGKFLFARDQHGIYNFLFNQGGSAVAIFFVLSGFVISFVTSEKEREWRRYFVARASRIYSVAWAAIAVTAIADLVGRRFNAPYYVAMHDLHFYRDISTEGAARLLSFTNELWFSHVIFGTDEPYWSLGFEVLYYVFFGLLCFVPGRFRILAVVAWLALAGPKIALYLPLWLLGVVTYKLLRHRNLALPKFWAAFGFVISILCYLQLWHAVAWRVITMYETGSFGQEAMAFGFYSATGILVSLNILAFQSFVQDRELWPQVARQAIRWSAGASFTLYLVHQPLIAMCAAVFPSTTQHALPGAIAMVVVLALVLLLAEFGERRKKVFSKVIRWLLVLVSSKIHGRQSLPSKL
jgi:peptidoglycan/LPS O-acetylase OafA/YrhL